MPLLLQLHHFFGRQSFVPQFSNLLKGQGSSLIGSYQVRVVVDEFVGCVSFLCETTAYRGQLRMYF